MMHVKEAGLDMKLTQKDFIEQVSVVLDYSGHQDCNKMLCGQIIVEPEMCEWGRNNALL